MIWCYDRQKSILVCKLNRDSWKFLNGQTVDKNTSRLYYHLVNQVMGPSTFRVSRFRRVMTRGSRDKSDRGRFKAPYHVSFCEKMASKMLDFRVFRAAANVKPSRDGSSFSVSPLTDGFKPVRRLTSARSTSHANLTRTAKVHSSTVELLSIYLKTTLTARVDM